MPSSVGLGTRGKGAGEAEEEEEGPAVAFRPTPSHHISTKIHSQGFDHVEVVFPRSKASRPTFAILLGPEDRYSTVICTSAERKRSKHRTTPGPRFEPASSTRVQLGKGLPAIQTDRYKPRRFAIRPFSRSERHHINSITKSYST